MEIKHIDRWGTICDDGWDILDANVACRQMGFGSAYEATHYASFGQGVGKVTHCVSVNTVKSTICLSLIRQKISFLLLCLSKE